MENNFLHNIKKAAILIAGQAMQKYQQAIKDEQEVLMHLADIISQVFVFESALLRTIKHRESSSSTIRQDMVKVLMYETADVVRTNAKEVIFTAANSSMAIGTLKAINNLLQLPAYDLKNARRTIADYFKDKNEYRF